jgi:hypothetical protein
VTLRNKQKLTDFSKKVLPLSSEKRLRQATKPQPKSSDVQGIVFWDVTLLSKAELCRRFGKTYYLHLQKQRVSQTTKPQPITVDD